MARLDRVKQAVIELRSRNLPVTFSAVHSRVGGTKSGLTDIIKQIETELDAAPTPAQDDPLRALIAQITPLLPPISTERHKYGNVTAVSDRDQVMGYMLMWKQEREDALQEEIAVLEERLKAAEAKSYGKPCKDAVKVPIAKPLTLIHGDLCSQHTPSLTVFLPEGTLQEEFPDDVEIDLQACQDLRALLGEFYPGNLPLEYRARVAHAKRLAEAMFRPPLRAVPPTDLVSPTACAEFWSLHAVVSSHGAAPWWWREMQDEQRVPREVLISNVMGWLADLKPDDREPLKPEIQAWLDAIQVELPDYAMQ